MLKLWLARHGEAEDPDSSQRDFDRQLTAIGRQKLTSTALWLFAREQPPEVILHSPLVRARQTAETIAAAIGSSVIPVRLEPRLAPGIDTEQLLRVLSTSTVERALCIGHQPDMSRCLAEMVGGGLIQYSPGTIAGIEFHGPILRGAAQLRSLVDPAWFA